MAYENVKTILRGKDYTPLMFDESQLAPQNSRDLVFHAGPGLTEKENGLMQCRESSNHASENRKDLES